jgi:cyclophilin family peptidyl-prolyl cis-trans isomerase
MSRQMIVTIAALILLVVVVFFLALSNAPTGESSKPVEIVMEVEEAPDTPMGKIKVELNAAKAPVTVKNFLQYVDDKHFDGTIFHRVMPDFMIQGGGMGTDLKEKPTRAGIKLEAGNGLRHERGTIAMARTNQPNSATAQFFINVVDNTDKLGPGGVSPEGYAVFGKVVDGMDVVDKIRKVEARPTAVSEGQPFKNVIIKSVRRAGDQPAGKPAK